MTATTGVLITGATCDLTRVQFNEFLGVTTPLTDGGTLTITHETEILVTGSASIGDHRSVALTDGADTTHRFSWVVPRGFHQLVSAEALVQADTNGTMRWYCWTDWGQIDVEAYNAGSDAVPNTDSVLVQFIIESLDILAAFDGITPNDKVGIRWTFEGSHVNNTVSGDLMTLLLRWV